MTVDAIIIHEKGVFFMPITSIAVTNFKSFHDMVFEPASFNIIIGSNASGKSNLIQVFKFLRDIAKYGLQNAVSLQGGVEYLRNTVIGTSEDFSFRIAYQLEETRQDIIGLKDRNSVYFASKELVYEFSLHFTDTTAGYEVTRDHLVISGDFLLQAGDELRTIGSGTLGLSQVGGEVMYLVRPPEGIILRDEDLFPYQFQHQETPTTRLIANNPVTVPGIPPLEWIFRGIKVYDFDPRLLKMAAPMAGKTELEKDGSNLAIVIKGIAEDARKKTAFLNLMRDMLPFVDDVAVEKLLDMSLFLKLKEVFGPDKYIPASMVSDGTINIAALIIALYFEERRVTIIEEPEKNIHPALIAKLVSMLKDASGRKQIIVTTHNPEMVKHVAIEDIILINRDKDGFSRLSRPRDKKEIRAFLEHEIGIDELFIQGLLNFE
ncbi:MAG TPA: AAA family ATPase [Methanoregulaceae archaeon]|nr:AAA family ATPase [Methanoregulaceae archaeon]